MTFSGGVAEYLYKRESRSFGDLGSDLAEELRHALAHRRDLPPIWDPGQGIRATVIGAAQFSVQISGNTILIADPGKLPLQNLPVLACSFRPRRRDRPDAVAAGGARRARPRRYRGRGKPGRAVVPLARRSRRMARLHAVAAGICAALPRTLAEGLPLVLLIDGDVGKSLGRVIRHEIAPRRRRDRHRRRAAQGVRLRRHRQRHRGDQRGADHHQVAAVQVTYIVQRENSGAVRSPISAAQCPRPPAAALARAARARMCLRHGLRAPCGFSARFPAVDSSSQDARATASASASCFSASAVIAAEDGELHQRRVVPVVGSSSSPCVSPSSARPAESLACRSVRLVLHLHERHRIHARIGVAPIRLEAVRGRCRWLAAADLAPPAALPPWRFPSGPCRCGRAARWFRWMDRTPRSRL